MLALVSDLASKAVLSLQTGSRLGNLSDFVVNPDSLKIVAFYISDRFIQKNRQLLLVDDIREISNIGFIINGVDDFVEENDVIALKKIIDIGFKPIGISIIDEKRKKIGKLANFTVDLDNFSIEQLYVSRGIVKSITTSDLIIGRKQIIEVGYDYIMVKSPSIKSKSKSKFERQAFVNPFAVPQPEVGSEAL